MSDPRHKFIITVTVNDDHHDANDPEWWADAATGALAEYGGVATFELLPEHRSHPGVGRLRRDHD
jgi:hypothetical protein